MDGLSTSERGSEEIRWNHKPYNFTLQPPRNSAMYIESPKWPSCYDMCRCTCTYYTHDTCIPVNILWLLLYVHIIPPKKRGANPLKMEYMTHPTPACCVKPGIFAKICGRGNEAVGWFLHPTPRRVGRVTLLERWEGQKWMVTKKFNHPKCMSYAKVYHGLGLFI